jgi:hypothetical protein
LANEYPVDVRRTARRLWLTGRFTDEEIAAKLGIPRADTIRDWRHQEGWIALARDISGVINDEATARVQAHQGAFKTKYDQIGQAMENMAVRAMKEPGLSPRDLKAIAGTFALTQRIRDKALGEGKEHGRVVPTVAEQFAADRRSHDAEKRDPTLGRCRTGNSGVPTEIEVEPAPDVGGTATRGATHAEGG